VNSGGLADHLGHKGGSLGFGYGCLGGAGGDGGVEVVGGPGVELVEADDGRLVE
jgi:hypothetical protein